MRVIKPKQVIDGDLGGCAESPIGDPQSWVPSVWSGLLETWDVLSVLDMGCGLGYSTRWFRDRHVEAVGVDGSPLVAGRAVVPIDVHDFTTGPMPLDREFDLCWCSEFVEHVEERYLPNIMDTFVRCRYVAMTHAVPGQNGYHHVNCQWSPYWIAKMESAGFTYFENLTNWLRSVAHDAHPHSYFGSTGLVFERAD